ncbi:hypothetical protein ACFQH6_01030 [Halobacteriaceae archaeon GCM10025711]
MGLLDSLRELLGTRAETDASRAADPDDLFQLSTAYVTMATELDFDPGGEAALCFASVDSTDFADTLRDVEDILATAEAETDTTARFHDDDHGYSWVVFADDDFEDLVTSLHFAADTLIERGYGNRLLAAVFGFERDRDATRAYWLYSFRRGSYYPFAPSGDRERSSRLEFKFESVLDGELDVEGDKEYWYPLWPSAAGRHPWQ